MSNSEIHIGHRNRIDEKSRIMGLEFLNEHEQLEKILFAVIPRGNTNEIAHRLLERFGSVYGVLSADADNLKTVEGVGGRTAEFLHDLLPVLGIAERSMRNQKSLVLNDMNDIGNYAKTLFYGKTVENLYLISLNSANQVIRFDKVSEGTYVASDVSVRKISRLALNAEASAVVLAHNHPGGRIEPSYADFQITDAVKSQLGVLGISLLAHLIVSCDEWKDICELKYIGKV